MSGNARKALIVEDHVSNVKLLEAQLLRRGFEAHVAYDGFQALSILKEQTFDIILLDIMLPGLDGIELCRMIKKHPRTAPTPIIMITALDGASDRRAGLQAGAEDFFVKPVDDEVLFERIEELLRRGIAAA